MAGSIPEPATASIDHGPEVLEEQPATGLGAEPAIGSLALTCGVRATEARLRLPHSTSGQTSQHQSAGEVQTKIIGSAEPLPSKVFIGATSSSCGEVTRAARTVLRPPIWSREAARCLRSPIVAVGRDPIGISKLA